MIILDTNVLSALMLSNPDDHLMRWLDSEPRESVWTTAICLFETRLGLETMPAGRRQRLLARKVAWCFDVILAQRVLAYDAEAAAQTAVLQASRRRQGRTRELRDTMIAGIAIARRATLATRNTRHFDDLPVPVVNPWPD